MNLAKKYSIKKVDLLHIDVEGEEFRILYSIDYNQIFIKEIIFDTIRDDYFLNIFKNVKVIKNQDKTVNKSKRILCSQFMD